MLALRYLYMYDTIFFLFVCELCVSAELNRDESFHLLPPLQVVRRLIFHPNAAAHLFFVFSFFLLEMRSSGP